MRIELALEGFPTPGHLPLIVGGQEGWFAEAGLELALKPYEAQGAALGALASGEAAFAAAAPLSLLDAVLADLRACGCFFETEGGVLLHRDAADLLFDGDPVQIAASRSFPASDGLARLILRQWAVTRGYAVEDAAIALEVAGPDAIQNLADGFDGAWPCVDNIEGEKARRAGLNVVLVKAEDAGLPNFAGLELFAAAPFLAREPEATNQLRAVLDRAVEQLREDFGFAQQAWYAYSGEEKTPVVDAVVVDTCSRFVSRMHPDPARWRPLFERLAAEGLSALDADAYARLYDPVEATVP